MTVEDAKQENTKKDKASLIFAIKMLLQNKEVETQEDIKLALQKQGFTINQAKISRVLHKIGAIKMSEGDRVVYRLPTELIPITPNHSLKQLILNIMHNDSLIVVHTAPGCGQFIARFLDQNKKVGILGTVSGDDTIFAAPEKGKRVEDIYKKIYKLLLG